MQLHDRLKLVAAELKAASNQLTLATVAQDDRAMTHGRHLLNRARARLDDIVKQEEDAAAQEQMSWREELSDIDWPTEE